MKALHALAGSSGVLILVLAAYQLGHERGVRSEVARSVPSVESGRMIFLPRTEAGFDQSGIRDVIPDVAR